MATRGGDALDRWSARRRGFGLTDAWPVTLDDLVDLARGSVADPAVRLEALYARRYEQLVARARGIAGFGAALLTALLIAVIVPQADTVISLAHVVPALFLSSLVLAAGIALNVGAARVQQEYVLAHVVLGELIANRPLPGAVGSAP